MNAESEAQELSFEQAIEQLEQILQSMEAEELPLEELIRRYEQAVRLLGYCKQRLSSAEQKIKMLTEKSGDLVCEDVTPEDLGVVSNGFDRSGQRGGNE